MNKPWNREDDCLLFMYYASQPSRDLAEVLGRSPNSIKQHARKLGLNSGRYLTKREIATIRKRFPHERTEVIAADIGRSYSAVAQWAHKAGLEKTAEYMKTVGFEKGCQVGCAFQFKPGQVPKNKGLRRPGYAPGRMASTQFKKGQRSGAANQNYKPVGTIGKDADGCLIVKVYDNPKYKKNEGIVGDGKPWEYMHRKLWREVKGPIPPKTHVAFIDGKKENIVIENLELVSFGEMCRRNSIHNLPADLKQVIQLNGALKRRLRRMENNGQEQNSGPAGPSVRDDRSVEGHGKSDGDSARPGDQRSRRDHNRLGARRGRTREGRRRKRDRQRVLLSS